MQHTQTKKVTSAKKHPPKTAKIGTLLSWQALMFENRPRSNAWYITIFIIIVSLLAYGLFSDNFLLSILAILIGLTFYLFEKRDSQFFKFGVTAEGVFAQDKLYKFSILKDFWIFYEPEGRKVLSLRSDNKFISHIHIPLGESDPVVLRKTLLTFLPEVEHEESFADSLEELL